MLVATPCTRENAKRTLLEGTTTAQQLFALAKDKRVRCRLLACKCLSHLYRSGALAVSAAEMKTTLLPPLVKLFSDPCVEIRIAAPAVLATLLEDNDDLQKAACDSEAISKLGEYFKVAEDAQTSPADAPRLIEAALLSLAAICAKREDSRKQVLWIRFSGVSLHGPDLPGHGHTCPAATRGAFGT